MQRDRHRFKGSSPILSMLAALGILAAAMASPVAAGNTRTVTFGSGGVHGAFVLTPVTAGGVTVVELTATNAGRQTLTKAVMAIGSLAATGTPVLPEGMTIIGATLDGVACSITDDARGAACDAGNFVRRAGVTGTFILQTPTATLSGAGIGASFKVAENVQDQGSNTNTFIAQSTITTAPTNSDGNATYLLPGQALTLGTAGQAHLAGDIQTVSLRVPGAAGGLIAITESDGPSGCTPKCIGQEVRANVRNGAALAPYLEWTLVIATTDVQPSKGGVIHTLDNGNVVTIENVRRNQCSDRKTTDCIVSFEVDRQAGTTTIVFRTPSNGRVKGFG